MSLIVPATYVVYCHTSVDTGKSYVGLTKKTMERRWSEHVSLAFDVRPRSKHRRYYFHDAIRAHGSDAWVHRVLQANIPTLEEAAIAEVEWIAELGTLAPAGYNGTLGGQGIQMTAEGRERHRLATREALAQPDVRQRYLDGIRRGHSTPEFLERNRIAQKLAQNRPEVADKKRLKMLQHCDEVGWTSPSARQIEQLTREGIVVAMYGSAKDAHRATGVNYTNLTEVARGLRKVAGGFRWRYLEPEEDCND